LLTSKSEDSVLLENYFWSLTLEPIFVDGKECCQYWIISHSNLNGWIPSSLIEWAAKAIPKEFENGLVEGCEQTIKLNLKMDDLKDLGGFNS
jgi:hypothetical protein